MNDKVLPFQQQQPPAAKELTPAEEYTEMENFLSQNLRNITFPNSQLVAPKMEAMFGRVRNMFRSELQALWASSKFEAETKCCKEGECTGESTERAAEGIN